MKHIIIIILTLSVFFSFAQEKEQLLAQKKSNNYVHEGNTLVSEDDFVSAEMEYRKAISEQSNNVAGIYNLGNSYYKKGNFEEALYRHEQAAESSTSKAEKHKAFHNIGNILMQNKKCKEAVEAFKNALRNNPQDDETRYNLGLAKECAKKQEDENKDDKQDKDDEQKDEEKKDNDEENKDKEGDDKEDKKDKEGDDKEDKKDEGDDKDKKEGEDEKDDEGKPKDEKDDKGKGDEDKKKDTQKPKPQPGQLSPQQIKNLLEAMNNQEQKVQEKINAKKEKGVKIKTEKDW